MRLLPLLSLLLCLNVPVTATAQTGDPLPRWSEGYLDIHHINTGRGDAAFLILPDGTTLLIDAGDHSIRDHLERFQLMLMDPKPDNSRQPAEWVARYIQRLLSDKSAAEIDYGLITHLHPDHRGGLYPGVKSSSRGSWKISGITEIAEHLPVGKLLDRGWPDYHWPQPLESDYIVNYRQFLERRVARRSNDFNRTGENRSPCCISRRHIQSSRLAISPPMARSGQEWLKTPGSMFRHWITWPRQTPLQRT